MCGIYGVEIKSHPSNKNNSEFQEKVFDEVKGSLRKMSYRGPDFSTSIISNDRLWIVGQNRLAIIGIDNNSTLNYEHAIRYCDQHNEYILVFNGEIYNYKELRIKLVKRGYVFDTLTDTEVLLKSLIEYGAAIIKDLDGQFSFFFRDSKRKKAILVRDRTGKKPLYYSFSMEKLRFSSEPNALVEAIGFIPNIKSIAISLCNGTYFASGEEPLDESIYCGIKQVQPGEVVTYHEKSKIIRKNFFSKLAIESDKNKNHTIKYYSSKLRNDLINAIKKRIPDEVSVGVTLSGGVDSSIIAAITADHIKSYQGGAKKLAASSIFYTSQHNNIDFDHARLLADFKGNIELIKAEISPDNFLDDLSEVVGCLGIHNSIRQLAMFRNYKMLKNRGIKVALIGEGADEFNWGYWHRFTGFKEDQIKFPMDEIIKEVLIKSGEYVKKLINEDVCNQINFNKIENYLPKMYSSFDVSDSVNKMMGLYATVFLDYLNKINDRLSMANSIEARCPFQDIMLMMTCLKIPKEIQVDDQIEKKILRDSFRDVLPREIYERKKKPLPAASHIEYHKKIAQEFKNELLQIDSSFWNIFNKNNWREIADSYNRKIEELERLFGDPEKAGEQLMLKRGLGDDNDIINGKDIRTNDVYKLLTILVWYQQNLPYKIKK